MATAEMRADTLAPLLNRLEQARANTDALFGLIRPEALYDRPIPERHRLVFYLGHLEAFDWNLLNDWAFKGQHPDPKLDKLFAFGIDPVDGNLPSDQPHEWPSESQIQEYNRTTRRRIDDGIMQLRSTNSLPDLLADGTLLHVAIEHRLMHSETLAYLLHQLPYNKKISPSTSASAPAGSPVKNKMVRIPSGSATLGQSRVLMESGRPAAGSAPIFDFGWDNEFEKHIVDVPEFAIARFPVTNRDFLEFVSAGGYGDPGLWSAQDWEWKNANAIEHPFFWAQDGGKWLYRGMFDQFPLPLDCPVYVSHAEASAYARWSARALPTEAQWHRAAYGTPSDKERTYPWGDALPDRTRGNFDFAHWDATLVTAHPAGASAFSVQDLLGNGWEWTSTTFGPFPGFKAFPFYPGYSANFYDGLHFVMKGGSPRSAECFLRRPFRNWFQPRYPYVYATFRCVEE